MAPSFFSKFVKQSNGNHSRSPSETTSPSLERASSEKKSPRPQNPIHSPVPPVPTINTTLSPERASVITNNSSASALSAPGVNVVPPSPILAASFPDSSDNDSLKKQIEGLPKRPSSPSNIKPPGLPVSTVDASDPSTPIASHINQAAEEMSSKERSRTLMPSSSSSSLVVKNKKSQDLKTKRSDKSIRSPPPPIITTSTRGRTATEPPNKRTVNEYGVLENAASIVESPTAMRGEFPPSASDMTPLATSATFLSARSIDNDTASIISKNEDGSQKRRASAWRRGSTNTKKPTGLASAIAASGLAMANPGLVNPQQFSPPRRSTSVHRSGRQSSIGSGTYLTSSPPGSTDFGASRKSLDRGPTHPTRRRTGSTTKSSTNGDRVADDTGHYSGLEDSDDSDDAYESDDGLLNDIPMDMPVTGFAVASSKRNADFHELFPTIPEGDYLIDDYGCALQRDILIQGRIYISENHICFHANIFGWITNLVIPVYEIITLEKKMTAFVIPNAILVSTRQNKYSFASFLARDTTYDVIYNIWRLVRPTNGEISQRPSIDGPLNATSVPAVSAPGVAGVLKAKVTTCQCGKEGGHYTETALETIIPGTPERIYNLIFASGFIKDFMRDNQKLTDIQISDWAPIETGSKLLARNMSYIKPLNASLGPKSTKCEIRDETVHCDFDDYIVTLTTTRTPEVPSGGVFSVKTRTCITWASAVSAKVLVTTEVEWTGRSFIKGIIERSAIDGQKVYHADLDKAVRAYIHEHQSEFIPEGISLDEVAPGEPKVSMEEPPPKVEGRQREHERNQRSLQWAWDTFDGAYKVAKQSTAGALELVTDAWDQSTSTTILYFVIVLLVFSNLWTLTRMGQKEEIGRRKELKKVEEKEKWVQSIVATLWDEIAVAKGVNPDAIGAPKGSIELPAAQRDIRAEVAALHDTLNALEERIKGLRQGLSQVDLD